MKVHTDLLLPMSTEPPADGTNPPAEPMMTTEPRWINGSTPFGTPTGSPRRADHHMSEPESDSDSATTPRHQRRRTRSPYASRNARTAPTPDRPSPGTEALRTEPTTTTRRSQRSSTTSEPGQRPQSEPAPATPVFEESTPSPSYDPFGDEPGSSLAEAGEPAGNTTQPTPRHPQAASSHGTPAVAPPPVPIAAVRPVPPPPPPPNNANLVRPSVPGGA